jgi:2,3,4,5-tetrahydropyridine-2-carboxylate N-succinyltransferase
MFAARLQKIVDEAWEKRAELQPGWDARVDGAIDDTLSALDSGRIRVAEKIGGGWVTHQWIKKAVLLSFRLRPNLAIKGGPGGALWWDKVPSKFAGKTGTDLSEVKYRTVPGCFVRRSAYLGPNVVVMPSFINVGAHVGEGTMIDSCTTIGSCAQIGKNCHISSNVMIGGVLEPLQANPVIIEDNCFFGAQAGIAEGVLVEEGSVLGMGVSIGMSTKIIDRESGEIIYGRVPPYSVVVPGVLPASEGGPSLSCAVIIKRVDEKTRSKTSINELLRD